MSNDSLTQLLDDIDTEILMSTYEKRRVRLELSTYMSTCKMARNTKLSAVFLSYKNYTQVDSTFNKRKAMKSFFQKRMGGYY